MTSRDAELFGYVEEKVLSFKIVSFFNHSIS